MATKPRRPDDPGQLTIYLADFRRETKHLKAFQIVILMDALLYEWEFGYAPDEMAWAGLGTGQNQHHRDQLKSLIASYDALPTVKKLREKRISKLGKLYSLNESASLTNGQTSGQATHTASEGKSNAVNETALKKSGKSIPSSSSSSTSDLLPIGNKSPGVACANAQGGDVSPGHQAFTDYKAFCATLERAFGGEFLKKQPNGLPYKAKQGDWVHVKTLFDRCKKHSWELTDERLAKALANFWASPIHQRTLGDFSNRFSAFFESALDRYGKPVGATTEGGTNATSSTNNTTNGANGAGAAKIDGFGASAKRIGGAATAG